MRRDLMNILKSRKIGKIGLYLSNLFASGKIKIVKVYQEGIEYRPIVTFPEIGLYRIKDYIGKDDLK